VDQRRAVLFDMDGIVFESEALHLASWGAVVARYGAPPPLLEEQTPFIGRRARDFAAYLVETRRLPLSADQLLVEKQTAFSEILRRERARPRPGLLTLLRRVERLGAVPAVASSGTRRHVSLVLDRLGLSHRFADIVTGDDVERAKPDPAVFLVAARRVGVAPERCLVVEDAPPGVAAARAAGMTVVAVPCAETRHLDFRHADLVLDHLGELTIRRLRALLGLESAVSRTKRA